MELFEKLNFFSKVTISGKLGYDKCGCFLKVFLWHFFPF